MICVIELPWPAQQCWPNRVKNRFTRQAARKQARLVGNHFGRRASPAPSGALLALIRCHSPTARRFYVDNAIAACKGYIDGVFESLGLDDAAIRSVLGVERAPVKGGRVFVTLLPLSELDSFAAASPLLD